MNFQPLVRFFCVITLVTFESYLAILWALLGFFVAPQRSYHPLNRFSPPHAVFSYTLHELSTFVLFCFRFTIQTLSSSWFMILPKALKIYDLSYNIYRFTSRFTVNFHLFTVYRSYMFCKARFLIRILLAVFTFEL